MSQSQNQAQQQDPSADSSSTIRDSGERDNEKDLEKQEPGPLDPARESPNGGAMAEEVEEPVLDPEDVDPDGDLRDQLDRITTSHSKYSEHTALGLALTGIHVRDRNTRDGGTGQVFVVGYESETDPLNPHNWSRTKRFAFTFMVASIGFVVGVASAIDSSALPQASMEFGVSEVVESMATGWFLPITSLEERGG